MLPKIKKFMKKYKKQIWIGLAVLLVLIMCLVLFKALFYSDSERATYGVRLRDIKENEFSRSDRDDLVKKAAGLAGVKDAKVEVKGRLIKVFITFEEGVSNEDVKARFNDVVGSLSDKVKGYYDVTLYAEKSVEGKTTYPVIGYKHKNNAEISFDVL